jgi:hypothetical protein
MFDRWAKAHPTKTAAKEALALIKKQPPLQNNGGFEGFRYIFIRPSQAKLTGCLELTIIDIIVY